MASAQLEEQVTPRTASDWRLWCRLCAKDDVQGNMNVFLKNENSGDGPSGDLSLATAIGKYFWVNISRGEDLPEVICSECLTLVTSLVNFSDRITRVQKLYCILQSTGARDALNLQELRSRFGLLEEAEVHYVDEKPKLDMREGLLSEESTFELENPLTTVETDEVDEEEEDLELPAPEHEEEQDQVIDETEEDQQPAEEDEEAVLLKLCDAYGISEQGSVEEQSPKKAEKSEKEHQCSECSRTYTHARTLHRHLRQDHGKIESIDSLTCPECSKKFRTRFGLERHIQQGHLPLPDRKQFSCHRCDKKFTSSASAQYHSQYMHLDERPRPVICEQCGVGVHSISALKEHVLKHTDYAPFECEICRKCFKSATRLKHHKETHDPHKYICPECGMQLNSRPTLNRHRLVHTDQMQHKCDYCGREFKRAKALKNHLILHTGLKPYSCDFCDRTFANGSNCRTHKKKAHPEELAAQEAAGGAKSYNRNIPKLEALKAFTKNKDNLSPVATKQSGCFAFGKKPKAPAKEDVTLEPSAATNQESEVAPEPADPADPADEREPPNEAPSTAIPTIDNIYHQIMINYR
ncbi:uncharacterized protein Dana_GF14427 [Drosophila ananassae]|uniref:Zinc finger protein weckle n=1 Tax=Drosophila ananassae TaxID=7217 RepID=B3ML71_DROAN|nr:zinc finger protein weckle [Drosophila ananassae]EDV31689.1 uncharacterized protein Dana_GF14427 [Drosophila ananassae]